MKWLIIAVVVLIVAAVDGPAHAQSWQLQQQQMQQWQIQQQLRDQQFQANMDRIRARVTAARLLELIRSTGSAGGTTDAK